jgi:hypothetical protein
MLLCGIVLPPDNDRVVLRSKLADRRLLPLSKPPSPDRLRICGLRGREGWKCEGRVEEELSGASQQRFEEGIWGVS